MVDGWNDSFYLFIEERLLQTIEEEPDTFIFRLVPDALHHKVWNT